MKRLTKEQREEMITLYKTGNYMYKQLDLKFGLALGSCRSFLMKRGFVSKSRSEINRKYPLNETFFDTIDSEEKAYFLGLLYADGCNYPEGTRLLISLQEEDVDILERFKKSLEYERPLYYKTSGGYVNSKPQYCLTVSSKRMSESLAKIGMVKRKSLILEYPQISDNFHNHFIRGYFDGDGSIKYVNYNRKNGTSRKDFSFCLAGTEKFLKEAQKVLIKDLNLTETKLRKFKNIFYLEYSGNKNCRKIRDWLYNDGSVFLQRKFDNFKMISNG